MTEVILIIIMMTIILIIIMMIITTRVTAVSTQIQALDRQENHKDSTLGFVFTLIMMTMIIKTMMTMIR